MTIDANTKLSSILKANKDALEAIASVSPRFEKLRNPLLRKVMAPRTSLLMAAKVGGCTVDDLFRKLEPLGFTADRKKETEKDDKRSLPAFFQKLKNHQIHELDVRTVITSGRDPLNLIMEKLKTVKEGEALKIINTFEPVPLINMLGKKGYETWVDKLSAEHIETWFFKSNSKIVDADPVVATSDWNKIFTGYAGRMETIDVRHLEMPGPMVAILEALDQLPEDKALFVHHKKIPLFLLPELASRNYEFRIREIEEGRVDVLIFRES